MGSAFGAGAGADMLQEILRRKFAEAIALKNQDLQAQHLQLQREQEQNQQQFQNEQLKSLIQSRQSEADARKQLGAERMASTLTPGSALDPATLATLKEGGLGALAQHQDATLGSTNLSGVASASGKAPRILGLAKTENPGAPEADIYQGTAGQLQAQAQRQQQQSNFDTARQDRIDARKDAQTAHEDSIRLAASLRTPPNQPQPQMFFDQATGKPRAIAFVNGKAVEVPIPQDVVKTAPTRLSPQVAEHVAGIEGSLHQLDKLEGMYDQVAGKVGPAAGRINDIRQSLPLVGADPLFANFKAETDTLKNATIKAITGAQMSQQEAQRILSQVPLETDKPEVWRQKAKATRDNLSFVRQRLVQMYPQAGEQSGAPAAQDATAAKAADLIKKYGG